jgi:hypothetical protein
MDTENDALGQRDDSDSLAFSLSDDYRYEQSSDSSSGDSTESSRPSPKRKRDPIMSREEWDNAILLASDLLKQNLPHKISKNDFSCESTHRYGVKESSLPYFKIFPWFSVSGTRFRQSLKPEGRQCPTIDMVIDAVNYFLSKNGSDYMDEELAMLSSYYRSMDIPIASNCLSAIVAVYHEFLRFQGHTDVPLNSKIGPPVTKRSRGNMITSHEWEVAVTYALDTLQQNRRCRISETAFTHEATQNRFIVKESSLPYFKIFPWFYIPDTRFRQSLKKEASLGATIDQVLEAMNYFLGRDGSDYSAEELDFLSTYFRTMAIPISSLCLSTIVEVHQAFLRHTDEMVPPVVEYFPVASPVLVDAQASLSPVEFVSGAGNRACWWPIRFEDRATRHEWCLPGAVFGKYSDGIGPLVPFRIRTPHSLVVYSVLSDYPVDPPQGQNRDDFVCIVLVRPFPLLLPFSSHSCQVGDAPVTLRADQYSQMRAAGNCLFDLYVTHLGDVCAQSAQKAPPKDGTIFARASWLSTYGLDEQGYPVFQGVRGVCARILNPAPLVSYSTFEKLRHSTSAIRSFFVNDDSRLSLAELMAKRLQLFEQLVALQNNIASERILTRALEATARMSELYSTSCLELESAGGDTSRFGPVTDLFRRLAEDLAQVPPELQRLLHQSPVDAQTREKVRLEQDLDRLTVLLEAMTVNRIAV